MKKIRKLIENFQHISDYMGRRQIATIAASTAFWFFLSIVPIVILCVSVLPYTSITEEQLLTTVAPVLPDSMNQLIRVIIADVYSSGVGVLSISIAATVWSSAMGFASLIRHSLILVTLSGIVISVKLVTVTETFPHVLAW